MSSGYFSSDTQILLADGNYKNITQIVPGDMVLNMHIKPVQVLQVHKGEKLLMCAMRHKNWYVPFYCTHDAQILIAESDKSAQWKKIDEINQHDDLCTAWKIYLDLPKKSDTEFIKDDKTDENNLLFEIGYIFGLYAGYGNIIKDIIEFHFGPNTELVAELSTLLRKNFDAEISVEREESCYKMQVVSKKLHNILSDFGSKMDRNIPHKYWTLDAEYIRGLFDGLIEFDPELNHSRYVTISEKMAQAFTWICSVLGLSFENDTPAESLNEISPCIGCPPPHSSESLIRLYSLFIRHIEPVEGPTGDPQEYGLKITNMNTPQQTWNLSVDCPTNSFVANNTIVCAVPSENSSTSSHNEIDEDTDLPIPIIP